MRYVIKHRVSGEVICTDSVEGYSQYEVLSESAREPQDFEAWDEALGGWVVRKDLKADAEVGPANIAKAHAQKSLEAAMILSGVGLTHGLLAEEARALGVDLAELATVVAAKSAAFRAAEVNRRTEKVAPDSRANTREKS